MIAVIGEKKSITAFKSLGLDVFGIEVPEDFNNIVEKLAGYSILFITEDIAENFKKELEVFYAKTLPAVLIIPGIKGASSVGSESLKKIIERALGSELNL